MSDVIGSLYLAYDLLGGQHGPLRLHASSNRLCSVPTPRLTRRQFWGTVVRTIGYIATALICSNFIHHVDHP